MKNASSDRIRNYTLVALPIVLILFGWYTVIDQSRRLEQATVKTFQNAELEVVRNAARAATLYIETEIDRRGVDAIHQIEQEVLTGLVKPIRIGTVGDAWIYSPEYVVFDESEDFPEDYIGKSMAAIFEIQKENGAWHYDEMTDDVMSGREGIGWYVWAPDKARESAPWWEPITQDTGREIAAWTPVEVFPGTKSELVWVIGMSSMLPELMQSTGAYDHVQSSIITMSAVTVLVFGLLFMLNRAETEVQELRQQVEALHIEIDESRRTQEVEEIVETDFFQDLSARAREMRERRKGQQSNDGE